MVRRLIIDNSIITISILAAIMLSFSCAHSKANTFKPDRSSPVTTITTLAWAMEHNDASLTAECFAMQSRFLQRLGGKEGLATAAQDYPPDLANKLYWENLRVNTVSDLGSNQAMIQATSIYQGEMIRILLQKEDSGWVILGADAYPLPEEARFPTTIALPKEKP